MKKHTEFAKVVEPPGSYLKLSKRDPIMPSLVSRSRFVGAWRNVRGQVLAEVGFGDDCILAAQVEDNFLGFSTSNVVAIKSLPTCRRSFCQPSRLFDCSIPELGW